MLGYPQDVENMLLGDQSLLKEMKAGSIVIDHTTSSPSLAKRIYEEAKALGIGSVDAPVSGGDIGAKSGKLVAMVGGSKEDFERAKPFIEAYSAEVKLMGTAGAGQHTKAANQIMIANTIFGVCESLLYAHEAGLDLEEMIKLLNKGAAGSF